MLNSFPRFLQAMRWLCLIGLLSAGAQAADPLNGAAIEALLRWDVAAVLPDARGQVEDSAPRITQLRSFPLHGGMHPEMILVCATLIFDEPETEPTGVAIIYARAQRTGPRAVGTPFFHGMNWMRGQVPLADSCDASVTERNWTAVARGHHP